MSLQSILNYFHPSPFLLLHALVFVLVAIAVTIHSEMDYIKK